MLVFRKTAANVEEVGSRQQVETLRREEKIQGRALAALDNKVQQMNERATKLEEERATLEVQKDEVRS